MNVTPSAGEPWKHGPISAGYCRCPADDPQWCGVEADAGAVARAQEWTRQGLAHRLVGFVAWCRVVIDGTSLVGYMWHVV